MWWPEKKWRIGRDPLVSSCCVMLLSIVSAFLEWLFEVGCHKPYTGKPPNPLSELVALLPVLLSLLQSCMNHWPLLVFTAWPNQVTVSFLCHCCFLGAEDSEHGALWSSHLQPLEPAFKFLKDFVFLFHFRSILMADQSWIKEIHKYWCVVSAG